MGLSEEARTHHEIPQSLIDEPHLTGEAGDLLEAFWLLSNSRRIGMGCGGIPLESIEAYCRLFEVYNVSRFVRFITYMDSEFLSWVSAERKKRE